MSTKAREPREFWMKEFILDDGQFMLSSEPSIKFKDQDINWRYFKALEILPSDESEMEELRKDKLRFIRQGWSDVLKLVISEGAEKFYIVQRILKNLLRV